MPPAKRVMSATPSAHSLAVPSPATLGAYTPSSNSSSGTLGDLSADISPVLKLPMPNLPLPATQSLRQHQKLAPLSVPPVRAMSSVFPTAPMNWTHPTTPSATMPPSNLNLYASPVPTLGEMTRSQYASTNASPSTVGYSSVTPSRQLSPSYFLTNRNSPYRPVRSVNTLLIPPPSTSLNNPSRNIGHDQMRYHPLGKAPTDVKAGIVPYMHHDAWPQPWSAGYSMPSQYAFHA